MSVGVVLFCTPGWSHRHTLCASASHFPYHARFFLLGILTLIQLLFSLFSSSFMVSASLAVLLTGSSWMSWLGERRDPECVGWSLEAFCMGKAHTVHPHTFHAHPGGIPLTTKGTSLLELFIC